MKTLAALLLLLPAAPDRLEMLDGTVYEGRLVSDKAGMIKFEVLVPGGGKAEVEFPRSSVKAMVVGGKRTSVTEPPAKAPPPPAAPKEPAPAARPSPARPLMKSPAEVLSIIKKVGPTPPDWYAATPLNYPQTLDLTWPENAGGPWDPNRNIGQFIWTTINENEGRWKEGVRFLHHVLIANQKDMAVAKKAMKALATMYHNLHEDWARAAFWWEKAGDLDNINLAHCYFKLGSKALAEQILRKYSTDNTRHCEIARFWAEMGEHDRALKIALQTANSMPDVGFLAAGDICRTAGRFPEALQHYQRVVAAASGGRDIKQSKDRAQASIDAIRYVELLNLKRVPDGTYRDSSVGYSGQVEVEVAVAGGRITGVKVTQHQEKQYYSSIKDTCGQILQKQGAKGVDATSGATITSEAVLNATVKAVGKGMK